MDIHGSIITKISNTQKAFWGLAFSDLKGALMAREGEKILQAIPSRLSRGKSTTASILSDADTSIASILEPNILTPHIPKVIGGRKQKSSFKSDEDLPIALREAAAFSEERAEDASSQLAYFNDLLIRSCDSFDLNVANLYQIPTFAVQSYLIVQKLVEVGKTQFNDLNQLGEQMSEYYNNQQDLSKSVRAVQKPIRSKLKGSQLWEIVEAMGRQCEDMQADVNNLSNEHQATKTKLAQVETELAASKKTSDNLQKQVQQKEEELAAMNQGFQDMEKEVIKQLNAVEEKMRVRGGEVSSTPDDDSLARLKEFFTNRIDGLESRVTLQDTATNGADLDATSLNTTITAVKDQVMDLSTQMLVSKNTITHLQNKINQNDQSYDFGDDNISSPFCVQNLLDKTTSLIDPGVCFDYMVITQEVQSTCDIKYDAVDNLKSKSLSAGLGLSQATTNLICLNDQKFPSLFCGKSKSGLSTFGTIKWSDWKQPGPIPGGISHDIMDNISDVKNRFQQAIDLQFTSSSRDDSLWKLLCSRMLEVSVEFVSRLVRYIDDMMHNLVDCAGNDKDQAWRIVMKAVQRIFEEYFAPVRRFPLNALPKEDDPNARKQLYGRLIWNSIRTYLMTKELMSKDIKHHHTVSSAYTEWAILNSGKQEAIKAKELATKATVEYKELSATINTLKKSANEATSMAKEAKKNADKAISQQGGRSGGGK